MFVEFIVLTFVIILFLTAISYTIFKMRKGNMMMKKITKEAAWNNEWRSIENHEKTEPPQKYEEDKEVLIKEVKEEREENDISDQHVIDGTSLGNKLYLLLRNNRIAIVDGDKRDKTRVIAIKKKKFNHSGCEKIFALGGKIYVIYNKHLTLFDGSGLIPVDRFAEPIQFSSVSPCGKYIYIDGILYNESFEIERKYRKMHDMTVFDPENYTIKIGNEYIVYSNDEEIERLDVLNVAYDSDGNI